MHSGYVNRWNTSSFAAYVRQQTNRIIIQRDHGGPGQGDLLDEGIPLLPVEWLEIDLNSKLKAPFFEASALKGPNVVQTMKKIIIMTIDSLRKDLT